MMRPMQRPPMPRMAAPMQQRAMPRPMQMQMQRPMPGANPAAMASQQAAAAARRPAMPGAAGSLGAGTMAMSDERSKQRIQELEAELAQTYRALGGGPAPAPRPQAPPTEQLDQAYRQPGSYSYEYRDPDMPGAAPGRQTGPMAHELRGIPGVVEQTPQGEAVRTDRLTLANASEVANQRRELDELQAQVAALGGSPRPPYPVPR